MITRATGWYPLDLRFGNGGGGAGPSGQNNQGWALGNGSTTNPSGKGFGYTITDAAGSTIPDPLDANNYRRLYASPTVYGINAITQSGTTVTVTTAAPGSTTQANSPVRVGDQVLVAGVTPTAYNGQWTVTAVTGNTFTFTHTQSGLAAGTVTANVSKVTLPDDGTRGGPRYGIDRIRQSGGGTTVDVRSSALGTGTDMPSGVKVGDQITISGITGVTAYNGTWTVTSIIDQDEFTFEHTLSGLADGTRSDANSWISLPDDKVRIRIPVIANGTVTNAVNVSGTSTIAMDGTLFGATLGTLSMASGATLNAIAGNLAGQALTFSTTTLAGNATFAAETGANVVLGGAVTETAAANITKNGAGTLTLNSANTYTGVTTVNAGTVVAGANGALGSSTGAADGTVVASGGRLSVAANYTNVETLSIAGTGSTATNGALASAVDATFAGPITLTGNAWIAASANTLILTGGITSGANQLTTAGGGTIRVQTAGITGTGKLVKVEGGTTRLEVASPNLTGDIIVNAGTLRVTVDGALGTVAGGTTVASGATLRFVGPLTYAALEPFTIAGAGAGGVGAINATDGNVTLASPIALTGSTTIGSGDAGFKLTLNGAITMSVIGNLTFTGAGNIDVAQGFGNGTTPTASTPNALLARYLHEADGTVRIQGNLDGVGAAPGNGGLVAPGKVFEGTAIQTGPLNVGDTADPATPATANGAATSFSSLFGLPSLGIANFNVLWSGQMTVTAPGSYQFGFGNQGTLTGLITPDAQGRLYLDIDKNGIFEDDTGEKLLTSDSVIVTSASVPLAAGTYNIAIPFTNGGGSGGIGVAFSNNDGATWQVINPGLGTVANTRFSAPGLNPLNSVIKNGAGTVTLLGNNTYNGTTTVNAGTLQLSGTNSYAGVTTINGGTLIAGNAAALGSGPAGTVVKSGGTLGFTGGIAIANESVTFSGVGASGQPGAIANISGANSYTGTLIAENNSQGTVSVGSTAGTLTLNGAVDLKYSKLIVGGAGDVVINGNVGGTGVSAFSDGISETLFNSSAGDPRNNIEEMRNRSLSASDGKGILTTQINYTDDNTAGTVQFNARAAALGAVGFDQGDFGAVWVTTFTPNESGPWVFKGYRVDDNIGMWIDLDNNGTFETSDRFGNDGCCADRTYTTPDLVAGTKYLLGISLTDTGGGGFMQNSQFMSPSPAGAGGGVLSPLDPSAFPGLFQVAFIADNSLIKNGAGTLTLNGANTYNGNTTVTGGTVNYTSATAYSASPTSTLTVSGPTSVVNLFDNATAVTTVDKADFSSGDATINTGAGKLAVRTQLSLADGYVATGNLTAEGASLAKSSEPRTLTAVTGTLKIDGPGQFSTISRVNAPSNFYEAGGGVKSTTYTVTGGNVLVVEVGQRSVNAPPDGVTYNGVPLTLAVQATYVQPTNREVSIWYLMNPAPATNGILDVSTVGGNSETWISAFTLSGVDTARLPNTTAGHVSSISRPGGLATGATLSDVRPGSWIVIGETANPNGATYAWTATGAANLPVVPYILNNGNVSTSFGTGAVQGVTAAGSYTINATQTAGGTIDKSALVAAVFSSSLLGNATIDLPLTNVVLSNGTTLALSGSGAATLGSVTANGAANVGAGTTAPTALTIGGSGAAGIGTLGINDNLGLRFAAGSTYKADVNGALAGQFDRTNVNGAVNLNGATLQVTSGFTPAVGATFTIISNDGVDAVVGTFAGVPEGGFVVGGTANYTVSYVGGDGNDVVLTALAPGAATTTTLQANPQATTGGSLVTFTATIAPSPGNAGTVTFLDNGVAIPGGANLAVSGGQAVFSTSTLGVGVHPVTAAYSGAPGFASSTSAPVDVTITSGGTAPTVSSFTINGTAPGFGGAQRSRVVDLTIVFDQAVQLDADAVTLALHPNVDFGGPQPGGVGALPTLTVTPSSDNKTFTVTFSGANTVVDPGADGFPSLKDGVYDYTIVASKVHPLGTPGVSMAANSTGTFHRLFGDINPPAQTGNSFTAIVNTGDNLQFRNAFNKPVGGGYLPYFDVNGDGTINSGDNLQFRNRFNKALTWTV
jgi:fibronectin-binding autotransporter adhesin